jgi:prepilin-type N-terminal cleavage/methylation domain-containing protein
LIRRLSKSAGARGFTLFEILVVVIIVSITVSAVLLSTNLGSDSNDLKVLGKDLSKLIHLLYQEAIFENRNYAISLHHQGFKVLEYDGEDWVVADQSFFRKVKLSESQSSNLIVENFIVQSVDQDDLIPHILILSSGEMSAFEWSIDDSDSNANITIQGDLLGKILMSGPIPQS